MLHFQVELMEVQLLQHKHSPHPEIITVPEGFGLPAVFREGRFTRFPGSIIKTIVHPAGSGCSFGVVAGICLFLCQGQYGFIYFLFGAEKTIQLTIYFQNALQRLLNTRPVFGGRCGQCIGSGPDTEIRIMGDQGISGSLGNLCAGTQTYQQQ